MQAAIVAIVGVERVIVLTGEHKVLAIDRSAEEFDPVVRAVVDLDIVDHRSRTDAGKRYPVQLIACRDFKTGMLDQRIAQRAAIIRWLGTAVDGIRIGHTFNHVVTGDCRRCRRIAAAVDRCTAEDHQAAPFADGVFRVHLGIRDIGFRCQDNRVFLGSVGEYLGTTVHDNIVGAAPAKHRHARFNRQRCRITRSCRAIGANIDADIQTSDNFIDISACQANIIGDHT